MAITKEKKAELVKEFQANDGDTGSPDVQIAILTTRINHLTEHMRSNKKDFATRRGLLGMVSRRRRLLDYVRKNDADRYLDLLAMRCDGCLDIAGDFINRRFKCLLLMPQGASMSKPPLFEVEFLVRTLRGICTWSSVVGG